MKKATKKTGKSIIGGGTVGTPKPSDKKKAVTTSAAPIGGGTVGTPKP